MSFGSKDLLPRLWLPHFWSAFVLLAMVTIWICNQWASILSILFPCLEFISLMVNSHWAELEPKEDQVFGPEQWGTKGLGPCPGSGVMWILPHSFIQPICSWSLFLSQLRPVWICHNGAFTLPDTETNTQTDEERVQNYTELFILHTDRYQTQIPHRVLC